MSSVRDVVMIGAWLNASAFVRREFPQTPLDPIVAAARLDVRTLTAAAPTLLAAFVVVQVLLLVTVVRFRARPGSPLPAPGSPATALWMLAPAILIALVLAVAPVLVAPGHSPAVSPSDPVRVTAIGHQWWWEFRYPQLGIVTAGEMHVPAGRAVMLTVEAADMQHALWVPALGVRRDAGPGRSSQFLFSADTTGVFPGMCVQLCGTSHANMRMKLFVDAPQDFAEWASAQRMTAAPCDSTDESPRLEGRAVFVEQPCSGCHTIAGLTTGVIGPDLTHFASRTTLGGAVYDRTDAMLADWLRHAPEMKPGSTMPALKLDDRQVRALVAYLQSLR